MQLGSYGSAFLVSNTGVFISQQDENLVMRENIFSLAQTHNHFELREIGKRMTRGETGFTPFDCPLSDELCWLVYVPVETTGWALAALFPQHELLEQIHELSRNQLKIGFVCFLLLFLVVLLIAGSITRPILQLDRAVATLVSGNLETPLPTISGQDEIARLGQSFSKMRNDLRVYMHRLTETVAAKERIESELQIARHIQSSMLPRLFPPFPDRTEFNIYAFMEPAREVGGDFYDFFFITPDKLCCIVGDVSGKGIPAALFMVITKALLRMEAMNDIPPEQILERVNNHLCPDNDECMFITVYCAILNVTTGELCCANAGHNPPALCRARDGEKATFEFMTTNSNLVLGVMPDMEFKPDSVTIEAGDIFFPYTDGVTEAMNPRDEQFSEVRFKETLTAVKDASLERILQKVREEITAFADGAEQSDDITMLCLKYNGKNKK